MISRIFSLKGVLCLFLSFSVINIGSMYLIWPEPLLNGPITVVLIMMVIAIFETLGLLSSLLSNPNTMAVMQFEEENRREKNAQI